jgi:catechol 2,3-dioxygenase-like lactoylglutathione lyase family enzyme
MIGTIHHIEIYCSNLTKSKEFWSWFLQWLGYEKYQEWERGISWKKFQTYIVLVQADEKYKNNHYNRKNPGLNHIAFFVDAEEQISEFMKLLKLKQIEPLYSGKYSSINGSVPSALFFEDPERIKIELVLEL